MTVLSANQKSNKGDTELAYQLALKVRTSEDLGTNTLNFLQALYQTNRYKTIALYLEQNPESADNAADQSEHMIRELTLPEKAELPSTLHPQKHKQKESFYQINRIKTSGNDTSERKALVFKGQYQAALLLERADTFDKEAYKKEVIFLQEIIASFLDHTDRLLSWQQFKQEHETLKKRKLRWKHAIEGNRDGVWDWDLVKNTVFFSEQWKTMLGFDSDEIGNSLDEWKFRVHPDDVDEAMEQVNLHLQNKTDHYYHEHRIRTKSGEYLWIADRGKVIEWDNQGNPVHFVGTHTDISRRKKLEESLEEERQKLEEKVKQRTAQLKESEQRYKKIFHNIQDVYFEMDEHQTILLVSPSVGQFGYYPADFEGRQLSEFLAEEDIRILKNKLKEEKVIRNFELPFVFDNNEERQIALNIRQLQEEGIRKIVGSMRDVTEKRQYTNQLAASEKKFRSYTENSPVGIEVFDDEGRINYYNEAFRKIFELGDYSDPLYYSQLHFEEYLDTAHTHFEQFKQKKNIDIETESKTFKGKKIKIRLIAKKLESNLNIGFVQDVTNEVFARQLMQIERDLAINLKQASSLTDTFDTFLKTLTQVEDIDSGGIYLASEKGLELKAAHNLSADFVNKTRFYSWESPNAEIVKAGHYRFLNTEEVAEITKSTDISTEIKALAVIPIIHKKQLIGCMNVASKNTSQFTTSTREIVKRISGQIGEFVAMAKKEEEVRRQYEDLERLFNTLGSYLFVLDLEGNIIQANQAVYDVLGYRPEEITGKSVLTVHPGERHKEAEHVIQSMLQGTTDACYIPLKTKDGKYIPVETRVVAGKWQGKNALIGMSWDLTKLEEANKSARQSELKFKHVFNASQTGILFMNESGRVVDLNHSFTEITGFQRENVIGKEVKQLLESVCLDKENNPVDFYKIFKQRGTQPLSEIFRIKNPDKWQSNEEPRWVEVTYYYQQTGEDSFVTFNDVTASMQYRQKISQLNEELEEKVAKRTRELTDKQNELSKILETMQIGFYRTSPDGKIIMANPAMVNILGFDTEEELQKVNVEDYYADYIAKKRFDDLMKKEKRVKNLEARWLTKDKQIKHIIENSRLVEDANGKSYFEGTVMDITDKRKIENTLLSTQATYSTLVEQAPIGILYATQDGEIQYINKALLRILGSKDIKITKNINLLKDSSMQKHGISDLMKHAIENNQHTEKELSFTSYWGNSKYIKLTLNPIPMSREYGIMMIALDKTHEHDIQKQKENHMQLENILLQTSTLLSETTYAKLETNIEGALGKIGKLMDADRVYIFEYHDNETKMTNTYEWVAEGISREKENLTNLPVDMFPWWNEKIRRKEQISIPDVSDMPEEAVNEQDILKAQNIQSLVVLPVIYKNKSLGFIGFDSVKNKRNFENYDLMVLQILGDLVINTKVREKAHYRLSRQNEVLDEKVRERTHDLQKTNQQLTDEIEHRKKLEEQGKLLWEALDYSSNGVIITNNDFHIYYANDSVTNMTGLSKEQLIGRHTDIFSRNLLSDDRNIAINEIAEALSKHKPWKGEIDFQTPAGIKIHNVLITPILSKQQEATHYVIMVADVTYNKKLEKELQLSEKMAAIGTLAGSIAHEFNNLLQVISVYSELIEMKQPNDTLASFTKEIANATERGANLVSSLLSYSRQSDDEMHPINLKKTVSRAMKMIYPLVKSNVQLETDLQDTGEILGHPNKIEQVLVNLFSNAQKAVKGTSHAWIKIALCEKEVVKDEEGERQGRWAQITVEDNGVGITPEAKQKIFDLFYTTDEVGEGTGIGLSSVQKIVQQHQGFIHLESEHQKGTTFYINLPILSKTK